MPENDSIKKILINLIAISTIVRGFFAFTVELGNDEVYYYTYTLYPALSYFDHPGMQSWLMRLTTLGMKLDGEFFIRLQSVVFGSLNTYLIFVLTKKFSNRKAGLYAAFLYTGSLYASIICGLFAMPDAPLSFFVLLSIILLSDVVYAEHIGKVQRQKLLLASITIGLATLSKYSGIYLWASFALFVLFFKRGWLRQPVLYIAPFITLAVISPIIIWSLQNNFSSFGFHLNRVNMQGFEITLDYFFRELLGGIVYNNPINWFVYLTAITAFFSRKKNGYIGRDKGYFLLIFSLPVILIFLLVALFRETLPHWSGIAFFPLMALSAVYLEKRTSAFPRAVRASVVFMAFALVFAFVQIKTGLIPIGAGDPTLDMYGWRKLEKEYGKRRMRNKTLVSYRWFPAAHLDYYLARPEDLKLLCFGRKIKIHNYKLINAKRGYMKLGESAYFIVPAYDFHDPHELYGKFFEAITEKEDIVIERMGKTAKVFKVYELERLKNEGLWLNYEN